MKSDTTVVKMHHFAVVKAESYKKGDMVKTGKIFRIMDVDKWVYECAKCQTKFELSAPMKIEDVNREITLRLPCL